jgi:type VI secretion system secreted protein VgrG
VIAQSIIETAIDRILDDEGAFVDDPKDPGGATNFGITQATSDQLGDGDVRNLTIDQAREAYRTLISEWGIGAIPDKNTFLLIADACTNNGALNATRWLQRAIGIPEASVDGDIGPKTIAQIATVTDWSQVFGNILAQRVQFYGKIVVSHPEEIRFLVGWINRSMQFLQPFPKWA